MASLQASLHTHPAPIHSPTRIQRATRISPAPSSSSVVLCTLNLSLALSCSFNPEPTLQDGRQSRAAAEQNAQTSAMIVSAMQKDIALKALTMANPSHTPRTHPTRLCLDVSPVCLLSLPDTAAGRTGDSTLRGTSLLCLFLLRDGLSRFSSCVAFQAEAMVEQQAVEHESAMATLRQKVCWGMRDVVCGV